MTWRANSRRWIREELSILQRNHKSEKLTFSSHTLLVPYLFPPLPLEPYCSQNHFVIEFLCICPSPWSVRCMSLVIASVFIQQVLSICCRMDLVLMNEKFVQSQMLRIQNAALSRAVCLMNGGLEIVILNPKRKLKLGMISDIKKWLGAKGIVLGGEASKNSSNCSL